MAKRGENYTVIPEDMQAVENLRKCLGFNDSLNYKDIMKKAEKLEKEKGIRQSVNLDKVSNVKKELPEYLKDTVTKVNNTKYEVEISKKKKNVTKVLNKSDFIDKILKIKGV